jgi:hypothetical protein
MKIGKWFRLWERTAVTLGKGTNFRLVIFEVKHLASAYLNRWRTEEQDRFHTHAFYALSIGLRGYYWEERLADDGSKRTVFHCAPWVRIVPRTYNHRILGSSLDALSLTITGPWDRLWTETFLDGTKRVLGWGRVVVARQRTP